VTLDIGARLGPYQIVKLIGAGGMGEVYSARDTRLDRSVAIKVLSAQVSVESDRRARFEREARSIAGLNHPHICTLHDVGEHAQTGDQPAVLYLVMELLAGETLAERLRKGPLPFRKALAVATEVADALAAAHRQGIIHRDLKPGNVMLTPAGAKLLDFGLAKLRGHGEQPLSVSGEGSATQLGPLTGEGVIAGTLQYMAPEQLEAKAADARTDLWALGAMVYEMLTGKQAFEGESQASVVAAILEREPPPLSALQPLSPPELDQLVRRCLAKKPDNRWDSAHDVADVLRWMRDRSLAASPAGQPARRWKRRWGVALATGLVVGAAAGAGVTLLLRPSPLATALVRPSLEVLPADELGAGGLQTLFLPTPGGSRTALTWTPDGQALIFVGRRSGVQQIYIRPLDGAEARPLEGTDGAQVPAVSHDGRWIAFWSGGVIRKVPLAGGPVMDLVPGLAEPPCGLAWDDTGRLFFGKVNGAIWVVQADGTPAAATTVGEAEVSHGLPWPLPGGQRVLYTLRRRVWSWGDEEIVAYDLQSGQRKTLLKDAADARYIATGHLAFLRRGKLFAVPFDSRTLEVRGTPVPMLDEVAQALTAANAGDVSGAGQFAISASGTLAWLPSPVMPYREGALVTVDRAGQVTPLPTPVRAYGRPLRVSSVGHRLALTIFEPNEEGLWIYDLDRGTLSPLARDGEAACPTWSPDGQRLAFGWLTGGQRSIATQPADGTVPPQILAPGVFCPSSFSADGGEILAVRGAGDLVALTTRNGTADVKSLELPGRARRAPELSPDARWLVYESDASGRFEVYVKPYAGTGPTQQVSIEGGQSPAWAPSGREIFFVGERGPTGKRSMMVADFAPGSPPRLTRPRRLFEFDPRELSLACIPLRCYDVAPDGQRFYAVQQRTPPVPPTVSHVDLRLGWTDELKRRVTTR
jgi:serine/threonine-protein kinase